MSCCFEAGNREWEIGNREEQFWSRMESSDSWFLASVLMLGTSLLERVPMSDSPFPVGGA
jgi:hypothetical protein